jgi:hypothetical protein
MCGTHLAEIAASGLQQQIHKYSIMAKTQKTPTKAQFEAFEAAYQYFNQVLFSYELPPVILNLSRKSKAMGFVAPFR